MLDQYSRKIDYLRISITDKCNFSCVYCMPDGEEKMKQEQLLTYDELLRVAGAATQCGISKVKITGGEPLLRKDAVAFIKALKQMDGIRQVTLTTNGMLLFEHLETLKEAGIDGINISLDTLDPKKFETLTKVDGCHKVLKAIQKAVAVGIPNVKVNCVAIKGMNEEDLLEIVALAKTLPIHIRFIEMMPLGCGRAFQTLGEDEVLGRLTQAYGVLEKENRTLGNGPAHYYNLEGFVGKVGFISAMSHQFCHECNRVRLTADGILKPCLQYHSTLNIKTLLREGITDQELRQVLGEAIFYKPQKHQFGENENTQILETRKMVGIGG